jgi:hypothetical protein
MLLGRGPGAGRGLDGTLVGLALAGVKPALLFWVGSVLSGRISTLRARLAGEHVEAASGREEDGGEEIGGGHRHGHVEEARARTFPELVVEATPWIVVGVVLYALLVAGLRENALAVLSAPVALGAAVFVGSPIEVPSVTAMLIAVGLWDRGLRPDAALGFALMASAKASLKPWAVLVALFVGVGVGSGLLGAKLEAPSRAHFPAYVGVLMLLAAAGYVLALRGGLRGLFAKVFHSHDSA